MGLSVGIERWDLAKPFAIARGVRTETVTVVARVTDGTHVGIAECTPYPRYGESPESVLEEIAAQRDALSDLYDPAAHRARLLTEMGAGAARNALDCALWRLEALQKGVSVAALAGLQPPETTTTAVTLSLAPPAEMAAAAAALKAPLLKAKLGGGAIAEETERLRQIRAAAPEAQLIVDANEGWSAEHLAALDPICAEIGALFIEQPLPAAEDGVLAEMSLKTPLCADESCHTAEDLDRLQGRYQVVNVKLDKTGGLTGGIALRDGARARGFDVMIGCMVAGSLAMAPAYLLTDGALAVDLDGPLLLAKDRDPAIRFDGATMHRPSLELYG